jgi:DNA-binding MarR family transcriptional regulator
MSIDLKLPVPRRLRKGETMAGKRTNPTAPSHARVAERVLANGRTMTSSAQPDSVPLDQRKLLGLVGYNCRRAYLCILGLFRERMAKFDLRPVDFSVLVLVRDNPNVNQKRLAHALGIDPPNMVTLLERLEARALIGREPDPTDRRARLLVLTRQGAALCSEAEEVVARVEIDATPNLTPDERVELMRLAQKVFLQ